MFEPNSNWALRAQCVIAAEGTGGNGGGGGGVCLHRGLLCALKLPAYGRSIRTHQRKEGKEKIHFHKKKRPWKSTSHWVWEQVLQAQTCVTPPLTSTVVKRLSARFTRCIYNEPEVMIDSPAPSPLAYLDPGRGEEARLQVALPPPLGQHNRLYKAAGTF